MRAQRPSCAVGPDDARPVAPVPEAFREAQVKTSGASGSVTATTYQVLFGLSWEADVFGRIRRNVEAGIAGAQGSDLAGLFSIQSRGWSLGASPAETLFDGGKRRANVEQSPAAYDASVAACRQLVLTSFEQVEDDRSTLRLRAVEARQQAAAVAAAERALAIARSRHVGGVTTSLEVVTAANAALSNERAVVQLQARRMTATVDFVHALGGGWRDDPGAGTDSPSPSPPRASATGRLPRHDPERESLGRDARAPPVPRLRPPRRDDVGLDREHDRAEGVGERHRRPPWQRPEARGRGGDLHGAARPPRPSERRACTCPPGATRSPSTWTASAPSAAPAMPRWKRRDGLEAARAAPGAVYPFWSWVSRYPGLSPAVSVFFSSRRAALLPAAPSDPLRIHLGAGVER